MATGTGNGNKGVLSIAGPRRPDPPEDMFFTFQTVAPIHISVTRILLVHLSNGRGTYMIYVIR